MTVFLAKMCKILFLAYFIFSCDRNEKVELLDEIPDNLRGEWVDELGDQKLTIEQNRIIYSGIIESEYDTSVRTPDEIYYFKRSKCQDCYDSGIAMIFEEEKHKFYLTNYHPITQKYNNLNIMRGLLDPEDRMVFFGPYIWKRLEGD